jgi:hypothetical protein
MKYNKQINTLTCFYIKQVRVYFFGGIMKKTTFYTELAYPFGIIALNWWLLITGLPSANLQHSPL